MAEQPAPQRGPVAFECATIRIEAFRQAGPEASEMDWVVLAGELADGGNRGVVLMLATLMVNNAGDWGQVQVRGVLSRARRFPQ